ncbi:MAG: DUF4160 domain-containing protein [Calditrichaeota bacterium]|nr:DUF4160 domain-containing protein [Calditrichota bacterium]MCB0268806.1 DUF4160 domain-containing protein [Calditrichota bacterium]MCB0286600.1 DUF4160 domain-containing protein [Calditrichota bacterium]MCB0300358.1 DUF4160 domain-containing protein [Calditrichota bacterium]MCB9067095.1 DUF4160 domain-containing protein [Calditrichia bacterium]
MPEISRFYGIIIRMYFDDHAPPHFHAYYGEHEALIDLNTLAVLYGKLPARALGLTVEWANLNQAALLNAWEKAKNLEDPGKIDPLV